MLCLRITSHGDHEVCWFIFQQLPGHGGGTLQYVSVKPLHLIFMYSFIYYVVLYFSLSFLISFVRQMFVENDRQKVIVSEVGGTELGLKE